MEKQAEVDGADELVERLATVDGAYSAAQLREMLVAELQGKKRKTVVAALRTVLACPGRHA